jgi:hypothetical protein
MMSKPGMKKKSIANKRYLSENRHIKNKLRKMAKTIIVQPNNKELKKRYDKLQNSK